MEGGAGSGPRCRPGLRDRIGLQRTLPGRFRRQLQKRREGDIIQEQQPDEPDLGLRPHRMILQPPSNKYSPIYHKLAEIGAL